MSYTFYCSGANRKPDYMGLAYANINFGISIEELSKKNLQKILEIAEEFKEIKIFADSGAFAEVQYSKGGIRSIKKAITHEEWERRLSKYEVLANSYGKRLLAIAPDCVGDQTETLKRIEKYKSEILNLLNKCLVVVPLQVGEMSLFEMYEKIIEILETDNFIIGIPCKKGATSFDELKSFIKEISPKPVHLLGMSPSSSKWKVTKEMILEEEYPLENLSMDSVRLRALVMRKKYLGPLTRKMDDYKNEGNTSLEAKIKAIKDIKDIILKDLS